MDDRFLRWYAVKLFERDEKVLEELKLDKTLAEHIDEHIQDCEKEMDDDAESIITNQRYAYINTVVHKAVKKKARKDNLTVSDKIDQIVTNRILALPIFAVIMCVVYYVAVSSLGGIVTDWTNDTLFGTWIQPGVQTLLENAGAADWVVSLVVDGIIGGQCRRARLGQQAAYLAAAALGVLSQRVDSIVLHRAQQFHSLRLPDRCLGHAVRRCDAPGNVPQDVVLDLPPQAAQRVRQLCQILRPQHHAPPKVSVSPPPFSASAAATMAAASSSV